MRAFACLTFCAAVACAAALCACDEIIGSNESALDPKFVAAEADRGNLVPLNELAKACHRETQKYGRRREVCGALDRVGTLRKPLDLRLRR